MSGIGSKTQGRNIAASVELLDLKTLKDLVKKL